MSQKALPFVLLEADQVALALLVGKGKSSARSLNRARVLQFSAQGQRPQQVSQLLGLSVATVYNIRKRYCERGLQSALCERARPGQPRKVTPRVEAEITAIACSEAPDGRTRWTIKLINERLIALDIHLDEESVRLALKKANLNLGSASNGVSVR